MASWLNRGLLEFIELIEPEGVDLIQEALAHVVDQEETPQELKDLIAKLTAGTQPLPLLVIIPIAVLLFIPTLTSIFQPLGNLIRYTQERLFKSWRLDPISVITAWRRDPEAYAPLFDDLREQGWNDERIEALKFVTLFYPPPATLVNWQAREVFEPEMIEKYGLDDELGAIDREPFYKAGMTDEQITNFWRAHWEHASWIQVIEMLHRGLVTEADVWDWFRVVEIPPIWRQKLIDTAYTWPTRVDVRRWWDMRTIDEAELRRLYSGMGYHGDNLDNYVLWTKVYVAFPDLMARWTKGWLTEADVRSELTTLGMPAARVDELIQTKIKPSGADRTETERNITKTDIIKGVKTGVITRGEGQELLVDMGYDEDEAVYILDINIPEDEEDVVVKDRELTKADILKGLKTEVITEAEARSRLMDLRYSPADTDILLTIYTVQAEQPTDPRSREASKADIVLAVKKGLITPESAYLMLQDIGFTPEAAEFILMVKAETSPFSPVNYIEFKKLTQEWRQAAGMTAKPVPGVLIKAAGQLVKLTREVELLEAAVKAEARTMIAGAILPEETTAKLDKIRISLHRAEAALNSARVDYDTLKAEWEHAEP